MTKLTEINIPRESRIKIINMLDNLEWIEVKSRNPKLYFQFVEHLFGNKAELFWLVILNSCSFAIMHALAQGSIFGILLKIISRHVLNFVGYLLKPAQYLQLIQQYFKGRNDDVPTATTTDEESHDDDDISARCASMEVPGMETEEVLPKANDLEEKLDFGGVEDISMTDLADQCFVLNDREASCNSFDTALTSADLNGHEKLEQSFHQVPEHAETVGISLTDIDDDVFAERLEKLRAARSNN